MRLYLSSFRLGDFPEQLVALAGLGRRAALIANATDLYAAEDRQSGVNRELDELTELGFQAEEFDLRQHFDRASAGEALQAFDLVWVRGGDVFGLRAALAQSGADSAIANLIRSDRIVYGGYSAGACVLAPTLRGLERADDPKAPQLAYGLDTVWVGIGILEFCIVPHVQTPEHPENHVCDLIAQDYRTMGTPHRALRDGDVLIINGESEKLHRREGP